MSDKLKKYVLPNLPYLFIFWLADKLGQAFRLSTGANIGKKLMDAVNGLALLGRDPLPSVPPRPALWTGRGCRNLAGGVLQEKEREKMAQEH